MITATEYGYLLCMFPFLFPSVGTFFRRLVHIFYLFLLFFNDFDLFSYRFLGVYFKKPSEFNDVSKKVESPNQTKPTHNMADDFGISELVTFAPGFARAALRVAARVLYIFSRYLLAQ